MHGVVTMKPSLNTNTRRRRPTSVMTAVLVACALCILPPFWTSRPSHGNITPHVIVFATSESVDDKEPNVLSPSNELPVQEDQSSSNQETKLAKPQQTKKVERKTKQSESVSEMNRLEHNWKAPRLTYWKEILLVFSLLVFYLVCTSPNFRRVVILSTYRMYQRCCKQQPLKPHITRDVVFPYAVALDVGKRPYMEDRHTACGTLAGLENASLYAVFDGHGGDRAAEFVAKQLNKTLEACIADDIKNYSEVMKQARDSSGREENKKAISKKIARGLVKLFEALDTAWSHLAKSTIPPMDEGTTAVVTVVIAPPDPAFQEENRNVQSPRSSATPNAPGQRKPKTRFVSHSNRGTQVWVANAGDSRAMIVKASGETVMLTEDHKPDRQDERIRILNQGGRVQFFGVWRVQGVLAVSRAIGDRLLKPFVTATPEVKSHVLTDDDKYLVLATDGLWDVMSNAEVGALLTMTNRSMQKIADFLVQEASVRGSTDNITVVVLDLKKRRKTISASQKQSPSNVATKSSASQVRTPHAEEYVHQSAPKDNYETTVDSKSRQRNIGPKENTT